MERELAPVIEPDRPTCLECRDELVDSFLFKTFDLEVCDKCRDTEKDGKHELVTQNVHFNNIVIDKSRFFFLNFDLVFFAMTRSRERISRTYSCWRTTIWTNVNLCSNSSWERTRTIPVGVTWSCTWDSRFEYFVSENYLWLILNNFWCQFFAIHFKIKTS